MAKRASAVGKRSPRPRRAAGKKHPISPWAAYRATSTNSESPHWRRGVVLLQDPLELFGMPLRIITTATYIGHPDDPVEVPMLPPDHYGCGLGCELFTGTLAAVEEHERGCAHFLNQLLPEGLVNGDEDEQALNLRDIIEPLQQLLSVLQKERRVALASPSLVVLIRCCSWSRPIDTLSHRRSFRRRNSRPCLQRPLRHPFFRLLRLFPALYL